MNPDTNQLRLTIEQQHGGTAKFVQVVPVNERFEGEPVWEGIVSVFDLEGHPTATRAYAWFYMRDDGGRRFFAVLHTDKINSPVAAVRAAIVAEHRAHGDR